MTADTQTSHSQASPRRRPVQGEALRPSPSVRSIRWDRVFWQGRILPAFWTTAGVISLTVNVILIAVLIGVGKYLFTIKSLVNDQVIGGLHTNFVKMDEARITTTVYVDETIQVVDTIPVVFDLPLSQNTDVVLTQDIPITGATIYLNGSAVNLNIILPAGTPLSINLDMTVPVSQTIPIMIEVPVHLEVPVDIPLEYTELHEPFVGLRQVVQPYYGLLNGLPSSWYETPLCGPATEAVCDWLEE